MCRMKETTLITGSSSGIGRYLAEEFAKAGHPVVLVAPVEAELDEIAAEFRAKHQADCRVIAKDLERDESADEIARELKQVGVEVGILVNNAGHGFSGKTWEVPLEKDLSMIRLNVEAVVRMTRAFLPAMVAKRRGRLLFTASVAGFEAGPLLNVYHSTKAFVLSYAEALAVELEDEGVTVTALCPGPTDTDFFTKGDLTDARIFQKGKVMAPQDVARAGFDGAMKGDRIVVPGGMNKVLVEARRVLSEHAQAKMNEKMYESVPPEDQERQRGDVERDG